MKKLVISIVLVNLLAACASEKPKAPEAAAPVPPPVVTAPEAAPAPAPVVEVDSLNDPASILAKRSVYYPFDVSAVQDADERGSNEYNLALGQRRADGVKQMLVLGGAKASQIETVSYGEEKPKATGHDEASWLQNRRSDIKY